MVKQRINLFYLSGNTTGGWVTYTTHLMLGLLANNVDVRLYKIGNRTETKRRDFGYGIQYQNLSLAEAVEYSLNDPTVIVALQKNFRDKATALMDSVRTFMVFHDPAEKANVVGLEPKRCITIRKCGQLALKGSKLILHPYVRQNPPGTIAKGERACSICRIDFDKNTNLLLDANRLLPDNLKIAINGFENRLYTRFKLVPKYPEWEQSKAAYPRDRYAAVDICNKYTFTVDMSLIKGDGGGTQYAFLEAMDAGSINIIHAEWIYPDDEMLKAHNCLTANTGAELAGIIKRGMDPALVKIVIKRTDELLERHDAKAIAKQFLAHVVK